MNQDPITVNRIDWLRVLPLLNLWGALRIGFRLSVFVLCLLIPTWLFVDAKWPATLWRFLRDEPRRLNTEPSGLPTPIHSLSRAASDLVAGTSASALGSFSSVLLSALFVTFIGIAVARITATEFCQQSRTGLIGSLLFAGKSFRKGIISLGLAMGIAAVPVFVFWGLAEVPALFDLNPWVTNLCFPFIVLLSLFAALTILVCAIGWLLSLGAIGTDQCSGSDALSRGINYVLSHKTYTAAIFGFTTVQAYIAARIVRRLLVLSMELLNAEFPTIMQPRSTAPPVEIWHVWLKGFLVVPNAVQLGVFLSGMTIGYILLRQAEDAIQLREIDGGTVHLRHKAAKSLNSANPL